MERNIISSISLTSNSTAASLYITVSFMKMLPYVCECMHWSAWPHMCTLQWMLGNVLSLAGDVGTVHRWLPVKLSLIVVHTCPLRGNDSVSLRSLPFDVSFRYFPHLCPQSLPMIFSSPSGAGELFWLSPQPQHPHRHLFFPGMTRTTAMSIHHLINTDIKLLVSKLYLLIAS